MSASPSADWFEIERLLDAALDLPVAERARFLARSAAAPEVRAEVAALLAAAASSEGFLDAEPAAPAYRLPVGARIGPWRVEAPIGRGGMGEVYAVVREEADFQQRAALKLLVRLESTEDRARFSAERRILARLSHPGIAHLLDGGEHGGHPYAVMEYVEGLPLTEAARERPLSAQLDLFEAVCEAVDHAHRHFVVHRDLKPGNVLVTAEGRVKLLDFGIAKQLDPLLAEAGDRTQVLRLSPDYCAPEQLRGEPVTAATDVYALGVLLFELLTGQRLWSMGGLPLTRALERLTAATVPAPSQRVAGARIPALRGDLDAIVLKALRPQPEARYPSVEALLDDLRRHRQGLPVRARGEARGYHLRVALRRYRWWFAGAAALLASLLLGLAGVLWQAQKAALGRDAAQREAARADAVRQSLLLMFREAGAREGAESLTAKQVLDQAAERLDREYAGDPGTRAEVLLSLAQLYFHLNDYAGARPLLESLLAPGQTLEPATRAMAEHDLGQIRFRDNQAAAAGDLLRAAQAFWQAQAPAYREELLQSRLLESQIARAGGALDTAIRVLEQALADRLALSGPRHRQTGILLNNLGIAYFSAGRLEEAIRQFKQADALWQALDLGRSTDALNTLNNWASTEARAQRPEAAAPLFARALSLRRELYGPSAALAALLGNLGKTLLQLDRASEALPLLEEAVPMAERYAGAGSVLAISAALGRADAWSALGQPGPAARDLERLQPLIEREFGARHPLSVLLTLSWARWHWATGQGEQALAALARGEAAATALGPAGDAQKATIEALRRRWQAAAP
ncbi:MAG TPA: serine/threonine-protein kinase [Nevskiaceae bacterium]|nr:serine/threonine-protein kinase [Nevskiaceae bacterium]